MAQHSAKKQRWHMVSSQKRRAQISGALVVSAHGERAKLAAQRAIKATPRSVASRNTQARASSTNAS